MWARTASVLISCLRLRSCLRKSRFRDQSSRPWHTGTKAELNVNWPFKLSWVDEKFFSRSPGIYVRASLYIVKPSDYHSDYQLIYESACDDASCIAPSRVIEKIFAVLVDWYHHIVLTLCFKLVSFLTYIFVFVSGYFLIDWLIDSHTWVNWILFGNITRTYAYVRTVVY